MTNNKGARRGLPGTLKLDEETLKTLSSETKGKYYKAENEAELVQTFKEIAGARFTDIPFELAYYLMALGLLLAGEWVLAKHSLQNNSLTQALVNRIVSPNEMFINNKRLVRCK